MMEFLILFVGLAVYAGYGTSILYLSAVTLLSYLTGRLMSRHRWFMWVSVPLLALPLLFLRLQHWLPGRDFLAPLGISYFTLQVISYHVDLYRGRYEPEKNLLRYGLFVTYLPHVFLGPIESFPRMRAALEARRISGEDFLKGAFRALWGCFKKLVIAARLGVIVSAISAEPERFDGAYALAAMLLYAVQLYADFSGGIDVVLGISRMLGLRMSENFDVPYFSQSVREFWRRWHMTLGSWLREYVYVPLGGQPQGETAEIPEYRGNVSGLRPLAWHRVPSLGFSAWHVGLRRGEVPDKEQNGEPCGYVPAGQLSVVLFHLA